MSLVPVHFFFQHDLQISPSPFMFMVIVTVKSYRHLRVPVPCTQSTKSCPPLRQGVNFSNERIEWESTGVCIQSNDQYLIQETQYGSNVHHQEYWKSMQISFFFCPHCQSSVKFVFEIRRTCPDEPASAPPYISITGRDLLHQFIDCISLLHLSL